jgi:hypothetical protein
MDDMLELESQLVVAQVETQSMPSDAVSMETASHNAAGSYDSSKKSSTWKKLKKMVNQPKLKEVGEGCKAFCLWCCTQHAFKCSMHFSQSPPPPFPLAQRTHYQFIFIRLNLVILM